MFGLFQIVEWKHDDEYPENISYKEYESKEKIYEFIEWVIKDQKETYENTTCNCGYDYKTVEAGLDHFKESGSIYLNPSYYYLAKNCNFSQSGLGHQCPDPEESEEEDEGELGELGEIKSASEDENEN
jgi:hypothetical protein